MIIASIFSLDILFKIMTCLYALLSILKIVNSYLFFRKFEMIVVGCVENPHIGQINNKGLQFQR
jgi:hypothetical protein